MDGLEATRRLRKRAEFSDIPIIGLTASAGVTAMQKCLDAGCTEHLSKPIQSKELFEALSRYLSADPSEKRVFRVVNKEPVTENTH